MKNYNPVVFVFSPFCLLRPTTNRIYDMRLSENLASHGKDVTIVHPYTYMRDNISNKDISSSYGLEYPVRTKMLYLPLTEHSPPLWQFFFLLAGFTIAALGIFIKMIFSRKEFLIISRDPKTIAPALFIRKIVGLSGRLKIIFVAAEVKKSRLYKWVVLHSDGIMAGVTTTKNSILKLADRPGLKFILSLAPVPEYKSDCSKEQARQQIDYHQPQPLAVYTGKLGMDVHEVRLILEAAERTPEVNFLFTGGRAEAVKAVKNYCESKNMSNILLTGFFKDATLVRKYQLAADVLLSYYTSSDHLIEYNYPQKVNEYLSTGNPVITPDFPATADVLNSGNVFFVAPDDPAALSERIRYVLRNPEEVKVVVSNALRDIRPLSFKSKAAELLEFAAAL